jgi:hypothetical protein
MLHDGHSYLKAVPEYARAWTDDPALAQSDESLKKLARIIAYVIVARYDRTAKLRCQPAVT